MRLAAFKFYNIKDPYFNCYYLKTNVTTYQILWRAVILNVREESASFQSLSLIILLFK